jgi:hypothetical protein
MTERHAAPRGHSTARPQGQRMEGYRRHEERGREVEERDDQRVLGEAGIFCQGMRGWPRIRRTRNDKSPLMAVYRKFISNLPNEPSNEWGHISYHIRFRCRNDNLPRTDGWSPNHSAIGVEKKAHTLVTIGAHAFDISGPIKLNRTIDS